jgi:2,3,4,5-tetrahydropyridine-2,6-dicarboxylate N-succinyltransferase
MKNTIEQLFEKSADSNYVIQDSDIKAVTEAIRQLDHGEIRVCEKTSEGWQTNPWVKKAILLYFKTQKMMLIETEHWNFYDKIPLKKWNGTEGVRVVPQALVRVGSYVEKGAILMPSYINIGAYVGAGTMVDTWATVGSCAQIGANVHLSGGVGIGGVLEPAQAQPVVIEDDCFLGSRCIVVEGVHLEQGVVLGAGVTLTASTKIIDVTQSEPVIGKGRVPQNSVVIPGVENKKFAAGNYGVPCALIIGQRQASTNKKTSLNQALRDFQVSV